MIRHAQDVSKKMCLEDDCEFLHIAETWLSHLEAIDHVKKN